MKRALISVSNKEGLLEFAKGLVECGYQIISSGGTASYLLESEIPVTEVSKITDFPEILDGRVKTLHPKIHGGILARRDWEHLKVLEKHSIPTIDLVVVNLYPFKETIEKPNMKFEDAIENIDIGGPALIRGAAKNHQYIGVVVNPRFYNPVLEELQAKGELTLPFKRKLALEAFRHTSDYDRAIAGYLESIDKDDSFPKNFTLSGKLIGELRYGENPHQRAAWYSFSEKNTNGGIRQIQGAQLSFNNLVDVQAAWQLVQEFEKPGAVIVKHTNPCGAAIGTDLAKAYRKAYEADPVSAFGGIVALNKEVDPVTAEALSQIFLEAIIAPGFQEEALSILGKKAKLRLLSRAVAADSKPCEIKRVMDGFVVQETDDEKISDKDWQWIVGEQESNEDLLFAWQVVKHVKSNAIIIAKNGQTLGVGAGQMNRVGAAEIALKQAGKNAKGAILASDAFFPFRDTVDKAAEYGIKTIIQPGGSIRDEETISACKEYDINLVFTGRRHFKH